MTTQGAAAPAPWRVYGQEHAVASLRTAITGDRLAHAYLFTGPPGVGKATLARRLTQVLACSAPDAEARPCMECRSCRQVEAGEAPDAEHVTVGGACDESGHRDHVADGSTRIRICQVRRLERLASLAPFHAARRVFVIDTADQLQIEAAHALLKVLEEPPATVLLVMLATDGASLLPTIRSRCQEIELRPMPRAALEAALQASGIGAEEATRLATHAGGRFGLAMREHIDPSRTMLREAATADLRRLCRSGRNARFDHAETLARRWSRERESVLEALDSWRAWWHSVLLTASDVEAPLADARADAAVCTPGDALRALEATQRARAHLLANTNAQLALEVLLLDLPVLPPDDTANTGETDETIDARVDAPVDREIDAPGEEARAAATDR